MGQSRILVSGYLVPVGASGGEPAKTPLDLPYYAKGVLIKHLGMPEA